MCRQPPRANCGVLAVSSQKIAIGHLIDASADRHFNRAWHGKAI